MNYKYDENDDILNRVAAEYSEQCKSRSDIDHRHNEDAIELVTNALFASNGETLRNALMDLCLKIEDAVSKENPDIEKCKLLISALQPYVRATYLDDGLDDKSAKTCIVRQLEQELSEHLDLRNLFITATQQYLDNAAIVESPSKNVDLTDRIAPYR